MNQIRISESDKYKSFPRASFPSHCPVCNKPLRFESDLCLSPSNDRTNPKKRIIYPQRQTYYACGCLTQNYAWMAYTKGTIREIVQGIGEESDNNYEMIISLDIGYNLMSYHLLSDLHGSQGITDENKLYHHLHHNNDDIICFRVPIDDLLLVPYIGKLTDGNSKQAENIERKSKKIIDLATSLSLLSIMNFHNPDIPTVDRWINANFHNWLGFDIEIKDLFIYSGPAFWEHIKTSILAESIVTCLAIVENLSSIQPSDDIEKLKEARHKFIAHFDFSGENEKTRGYIESLYSTFNELVKGFNTKHYVDPYYLYINLREYYYQLPHGHTPCDDAFRNILRLIHSRYEQYRSDSRGNASNSR